MQLNDNFLPLFRENPNIIWFRLSTDTLFSVMSLLLQLGVEDF